VVDLKRFVPGGPLPTEGLLWISEQLPGLVARQDVTASVAASGGWAAYNIPFDPTVYDVSGYAQAYAEYGDKYSYANCSRAKIFARDLPNVASLEDAQVEMMGGGFDGTNDGRWCGANRDSGHS
jgi:hypothetical protein